VISNSSFQEWVEAAYPRGLDASIDVIHALLRDDNETRNLFDKARMANDGAPLGNRNAKKKTTVDIVNGCFDPKLRRPTGNAADGALRRLRKESETGNERAATMLPRVLSNDISRHHRGPFFVD
jgi:hypothetical protein